MIQRPRREGSKQSRSIFERIVFSFMGPPQLGDQHARSGYVPDPAANLCPKCVQAWEAHERVHTGTMTYRRCPPAQD